MAADTVGELDQVLGMPGLRLHKAGSSTLQELFALPSQTIDDMRYVEVDKGIYSFKDTTVPLYFLNFRRVRVCPLCLADQGYHRQVWDLTFIDVCPVHAVSLVDHCTTCESKISWEHPGLRDCAICGAPIVVTKKTAVSAQHVSLMRRVLSWLGGADTADEVTTVPDVLRGFSFTEMVEFCVAMGRFSCLQDGLPLGPGRSFADQYSMKVLERGVEIADHWPQSFHEMMERHTGMRSSTGSLTQQVGHMARLAGRWNGVIHSALADFLVAHPSIPCRAIHELGKEVLRRRGYCTIKEAQETLAVDQRRFASIRKSAAWRRILDDSDPSGFLPIKGIQELAADIHGVMSLAELGAAIGISDKDQLKRISDCGVFRSAGDADHYDRRTKHFVRSEVEALLALADDVPLKTTPDFKLVEFKTVVALAAQRGQGICEVIKWFRSGRLQAMCRTAERKLSGLQFYREEAIGLFDRVAADELGSITLREAAMRLSVLEREAYQLAKLGVLRTEYVEGRGNLRGQRVTQESIEVFNETYVSALKWAEEQNVPHSIARERLAKGLEPGVSRRLAPRLHVYRRLSPG